MKSSTNRALVAKKQSTSFAQVATNLLNVLQSNGKSIRLLLVMFLTLTVTTNLWGATTYKLTKVTSVSAGEKYVFEQGGYVMNNTVSSSALQCTNSYNTTGLTGTETYVWTLESATGGFYMRNVNLKSNYYLKNSSSTGVSLTTTSSIWKFTFDNNTDEVLIQNTENNNRFLGWTSSSSHAYKAYATSNSANYPHAITVYKLEEEAPACSSQVTITKAYATGGSFKVHQGTASGTEISSGGKIDNCDANAVVVVVPTADDNYTCTGVTATNSNSIEPNGNGNYTITYTEDSNISSTITVSFTENQKHTVTWMVDKDELSTEDVYENGNVSSVPTVTELPCGDKFVGWTTDPITTPQDNAPTVVFTTVDGSPAITEPTTFYAVFADYANE